MVRGARVWIMTEYICEIAVSAEKDAWIGTGDNLSLMHMYNALTGSMISEGVHCSQSGNAPDTHRATTTSARPEFVDILKGRVVPTVPGYTEEEVKAAQAALSVTCSPEDVQIFSGRATLFEHHLQAHSLKVIVPPDD